jgi:hypothetical protein
MTSQLRAKRVQGTTAETYTLSVDDPLHRFDSEGVISKNTAAEVAKLAMIQCDEARLDLHYGADMLLQVHDELIFECAASVSE